MVIFLTTVMPAFNIYYILFLLFPRTRDRGRQGLNPAPGNRTPGGLGGAILEKPRQRPSTWAEAWMGLAEAQPPSISHGAHAPQEPELDPGLFQSSFK